MKIEVYIHAQWSTWDKEYRFHPWSQDMSNQPNCGALVGKVEIDFDPPPASVLVNGTVENYRKMQQTIRAESESKCNQIQEQINNLLCIEHKPE